jgi:hypothetical protein
MKKIFLAILLISTSLFAELNWAPSYEQGLAQAKKEKKIIPTNTAMLFSEHRPIIFWVPTANKSDG